MLSLCVPVAKLVTSFGDDIKSLPVRDYWIPGLSCHQKTVINAAVLLILEYGNTLQGDPDEHSSLRMSHCQS